MKNWELGRRDLLKSLGLGAAMLPLLRSEKSWAQANGKRKYLILVLASEGYVISGWRPKTGSLMDQTLPASSSPLESVKSYVNFLHPLTNPSYRGAISGHQAYATIFWGGSPNSGGQYPEPTSATLDQVVANAMPMNPGGRLSLNFQVQVDRKPESGGRGAVRCFYKGAGQAINPELNPFKTYQTLFAALPMGVDGMPDPAVQKLFKRRKSVLDYVAGSLDRFKARVAADDRKIIDGHFQSVRSLEMELSSLANGKGPSVSVAKPPEMSDEDILAGPNANKMFPDIMHAYMDMIVAGLSAGITNVGTLQISDATGKQVSFGSFVPGIPEIGTGYKTKYRNWHDLGHNPSFQGTNHKLIADKWCMAEFAAFIKKLQAISEPGGTMLDNSLVVWGNHMEDGSSHATQTTPWVMAGKAGGALKTGICAGQGRSTADAIHEFARAMGAMPTVGMGFPEIRA